MITKEQLLKRYRQKYPFPGIEDVTRWFYFKKFYKMGWDECEEKIINPFPLTDPGSEDWIVKEEEEQIPELKDMQDFI